MKFCQLILRKIIKNVATRCKILRLKCTKFNFGWGSAPDPAGGAYSAPPDSLAGFKGLISKGRGGEAPSIFPKSAPMAVDRHFTANITPFSAFTQFTRDGTLF